jgi:hypothetical protein
VNFSSSVRSILDPNLKSLGFQKVRTKWSRWVGDTLQEVNVVKRSPLNNDVRIWIDEFRLVPETWSDDFMVASRYSRRMGLLSAECHDETGISDDFPDSSEYQTVEWLRHFLNDDFENHLDRLVSLNWWLNEEETDELLSRDWSKKYGLPETRGGTGPCGLAMHYDNEFENRVGDYFWHNSGDKVDWLQLHLNKFAVLRCRDEIYALLARIELIPGVVKVTLNRPSWDCRTNPLITCENASKGAVFSRVAEDLIPEFELGIRTDGKYRTCVLPSEDANFNGLNFRPRRVRRS